MYGSSSVAFTGTPPYSAAVKAAARAGTLKPTDYTNLNTTFGGAAGGAVSNASDSQLGSKALVSGRVFDAEYHRLWINSLRPEDPKKPDGQQYGYGIILLRWGKNSMYFHGGETPGYNSFIGYDPANKVTLIVWTNLTVSLDQAPDRQRPNVKSARSNLRGVTADAGAKRLSLAAATDVSAAIRSCLPRAWSCQGVFPSNGKTIASTMRSDNDGASAINHHDGLPPNAYHFNAAIQDCFGGVRDFSSPGWALLEGL